MKRRMRRRADALLADRHASVAGDLLADLRGGEHATDAGLGALAQLDRDALHQIVGCLVRELIRIERAVFGASAEVAGADLPNHVGATKMIRSQPTFARVVGEPTLAGAVVQRAQGVGRQRAEAHRRDVHQRHVVRSRAIGSTDSHPERLVGRLDRARRMHQILIADLVDIALGPECHFGGGAFGPLVDQRADVTVEGAAVEVGLDEVLLYFRAQRLQQKPHMPQDRVVPQHRVLSLNQVVDAHGRDDRDHRCGNPPSPRPHDGQGSNAAARAVNNATQPNRINAAPPPAAESSSSERSVRATILGQSQVSWVVVVRKASRSSRHCAGVVLSGSMPV